MTQWISSGEYQAFLVDIKQYYHTAQLKAAYVVNHHMIQSYWHMGKQMLEKQANTAWGSQFLNQLFHDLQKEFPGSKGSRSATVNRHLNGASRPAL